MRVQHQKDKYLSRHILMA